MNIYSERRIVYVVAREIAKEFSLNRRRLRRLIHRTLRKYRELINAIVAQYDLEITIKYILDAAFSIRKGRSDCALEDLVLEKIGEYRVELFELIREIRYWVTKSELAEKKYDKRSQKLHEFMIYLSYFERLNNITVRMQANLSRHNPPHPHHFISIYYVTNRERTGKDNIYDYFNGNRGALVYGRAKVSIPAAHLTGHFEKPTWWKLEFRVNPEKHIGIEELIECTELPFFSSLKSCAEAARNEAFVFIHGYNVSFDEALRRTGQLAFDIDLPATPILFSWPSNGRLKDYVADAGNAEWARPDLCTFLTKLQQHGGYEKISLIAHSMGGRALLEALDRLIGEQPPPVRYFQIVFAAPDEDRDIFADVVSRIRSLAKRLTLYASDRDLAMVASRKVNGHPRAGDTSGGPVIEHGLDTIDASRIDTSLTGHSYYGNSRTIVNDLHYLLRDAPPEERHTLERREVGDRHYWEFRP